MIIDRCVQIANVPIFRYVIRGSSRPVHNQNTQLQLITYTRNINPCGKPREINKGQCATLPLLYYIYNDHAIIILHTRSGTPPNGILRDRGYINRSWMLSSRPWLSRSMESGEPVLTNVSMVFRRDSMGIGTYRNGEEAVGRLGHAC